MSVSMARRAASPLWGPRAWTLPWLSREIFSFRISFPTMPLASGRLHPAFDRFKSLGPAIFQAFAVRVLRRRPYENGHRLGEQGPQLGRPLHVDVEDHPHAPAPPGFDLAPQRAVAVAVDLCPF